MGQLADKREQIKAMLGPMEPPRVSVATPRKPNSIADRLMAMLGDVPNMLNGTGIPERAAAANEMLNPLAAIPRAQMAAQEMLAPNRTGWERVGSAGQMLGEVAGVVAPMVGGAKAGKPVLDAIAEGLTGVQTQAGNALADMGQAGQRFAMGKGGNSLASKSKSLYDLPTNTGVGDDLGQLAGSHSAGLDIEGRPLVARYVVGRAGTREGEQSLPSAAIAEIIQKQTGRGIAVVPQVTSGRNDLGNLVVNKITGQPLRVEVRSDLTPRNLDQVVRHEFGHMLDEMSGQIPIDGLSKELGPIYHYGIEGRDRAANWTRPDHIGYSKDEASREYMAEAIRQYMAAPDTLKIRAPKTAARIRKYINENPKLKDFIQFNSIIPVGGLGLMSMYQDQNQ